MVATLADQIARQMAARLARPRVPRLKVNLYTALEVAAVAAASERLGATDAIDCLMVADSFLMTHLGRASTRVGEGERAWFLDVMVALVAEARRQRDVSFAEAARPWLLADMPDGATADIESARRSTARMCDAGADAVKLEVADDDAWPVVADLVGRSVPVVVHIGYAPQRTENARFGDTLAAALHLFDQARRARDAGACALVLERVAQPVNATLCRPHPRGLPVYSIFSGWAEYGGQSLNVFDSVVRPADNRKLFPPTATISRSSLPGAYTPGCVATHFAQLLRLALDGAYPRPLGSWLDAEACERLAEIDPWSAECCSEPA